MLEFKQWLPDEKKLVPYTAATAAMAVRCFFAFHYFTLEYRSARQRSVIEA